MTEGDRDLDPTTVGPYRLVQRLGEGGMGVVHLALDGDGRAVALKVLRPHVALDPDARRRLGREVSTLRRVRHRSVAEVLDADVDGDLPYLVTRFVPGRPLDRQVRDHGPLGGDQLAHVGRVLADALRVIHGAGVIHRDVKPANVMLLDSDPVLIDFGIAHVAEESRLTSTGLVMGTPGYLSPEVVSGDPVSPCTDWWGWGATLAFAATGRAPFGTGPIEVVLDRVRRGAADLDGVAPGLRKVLTAALAVDPRARPSPEVLIAGLDHGTADGSQAATDVISGEGAAPRAAAGGPASARRPASRPAASEAPTAVVPAVDPERVSMPPGTSPPLSTPGASQARTVPVPHRTEALATPPTRVLPLTAPATPPPAPSGAPAAAWYQTPAAAAPPQGHAPAPAYAPRRPTSHGTAPPHGPAPAVGRSRPPAAVPGGAPAGAPVSGRPPAGAQPARPGPATEPPRSRRTGVIVAGLVALAALAIASPFGAAVLASIVLVVARTTDRTMAALWRRRYEFGPRRSDIPSALVGVPWRALTAAAATIPAVILPLLVGTSVVFIVGLAPSRTGQPNPGTAPSLALGMAAALLTAWWGPGGGSVRRGARAVARGVTPGRYGQAVVIGVLALIALSGLMTFAGSGTDWAPLPGPPGATLTARG
jgi:predicted Ser/Thr protein kinase